jgi:hypothetical protein
MVGQLQQAEILLGDDADIFFQSDLGQYVVSRAQQESEDALAELKQVDPEDAKKIRYLQNRIHISEKALGWLQEMLIAGKQAMETLRDDL